eukprot:6938277-Prymnesium_polylepis.3
MDRHRFSGPSATGHTAHITNLQLAWSMLATVCRSLLAPSCRPRSTVSESLPPPLAAVPPVPSGREAGREAHLPRRPPQRARPGLRGAAPAAAPPSAPRAPPVPPPP